MLRELTRSDVDALHKVLGDAETMSFYPHPFARVETQRWVEWSLTGYYKNGHGLWAMVLKETGELIGDCGLTIQQVDAEDLVEVGWHVRRDHWKMGYATEAGLASRDWGFENLDVPFLVSLVRPENVGSWRVAEKLGMQVAGTDFRGPNNDLFHHVWRITRAEWEGTKS